MPSYTGFDIEYVIILFAGASREDYERRRKTGERGRASQVGGHGDEVEA